MQRTNGAGHVNHMFVHEDPATNRPPTEVQAAWLNDVQESLLAPIEAAGLEPAAGGAQFLEALKMLGLQKLKSATPLPATNIGPIWHDDYASIMTWQSFTANGAAYSGYASQYIGSLLADTQPMPRAGYLRSGEAALSRTAYAALRAWAQHTGRMVAAGTWAAGSLACADNADGATFRIFDVRAEFPRFFDDGRSADQNRGFGSWQSDKIKAHAHLIYLAESSVGSDLVSVLKGTVIPSGVFEKNIKTDYVGEAETCPRNVSLLASIKF